MPKTVHVVGVVHTKTCSAEYLTGSTSLVQDIPLKRRPQISPRVVPNDLHVMRVVQKGMAVLYIGRAESCSSRTSHSPQRLPQIVLSPIGAEYFASDACGPDQRVVLNTWVCLASLPKDIPLKCIALVRDAKCCAESNPTPVLTIPQYARCVSLQSTIAGAECSA